MRMDIFSVPPTRGVQIFFHDSPRHFFKFFLASPYWIYSNKPFFFLLKRGDSTFLSPPKRGPYFLISGKS